MPDLLTGKATLMQKTRLLRLILVVCGQLMTKPFIAHTGCMQLPLWIMHINMEMDQVITNAP